jgi:hypothetical protein
MDENNNNVQGHNEHDTPKPEMDHQEPQEARVMEDAPEPMPDTATGEEETPEIQEEMDQPMTNMNETPTKTCRCGGINYDCGSKKKMIIKIIVVIAIIYILTLIF